MGGNVNTGGQTQNQTQAQTHNNVQSTTPWAPGAGVLTGLLGNLSGINPGLSPTAGNAIATMNNLGGAGNPFTGGISNVASTLLGGGGPDRTGTINDAYSQYMKATNPLVDPSNLDPMKTPGLSDALATIRNDVTNNVNGMFAGAGRDLSGMNTQTLARGIAQGEAPAIVSAYQSNADRLANTASNRFGAGSTTTGLLSGLDQTRLGNMQAGIGASNSANAAAAYGPMMQLQAEAARTGIPLSALSQMFGMTMPATSAFGTTTGTGTGQGTTNGTTENNSPLWQQIVGGILGSVGATGQAGMWGSGGTAASGATMNPGILAKMFM